MVSLLMRRLLPMRQRFFLSPALPLMLCRDTTLLSLPPPRVDGAARFRSAKTCLTPRHALPDLLILRLLLDKPRLFVTASRFDWMPARSARHSHAPPLYVRYR